MIPEININELAEHHYYITNKNYPFYTKHHGRIAFNPYHGKWYIVIAFRRLCLLAKNICINSDIPNKTNCIFSYFKIILNNVILHELIHALNSQIFYEEELIKELTHILGLISGKTFKYKNNVVNHKFHIFNIPILRID